MRFPIDDIQDFRHWVQILRFKNKVYSSLILEDWFVLHPEYKPGYVVEFYIDICDVRRGLKNAYKCYVDATNYIEDE